MYLILGWIPILATLPVVFSMEKDTSHLITIRMDNLQLKQIPIDIPRNIQFVDLSYNSIKSLPSGGSANFSECLKLFLNGNKITKIESGAFKGMINLLTLDLRFNFLIELSRSMWIGISSLQELKIAANEMTIVETVKDYELEF